jgi:hypothetical protein
MRPRRAFIFRPKRAWGMPDAQCTRGLVCNCSDRTHTSNNEHTGITRHPRTQWFYGLCRALPGDRAFLPPSPRGYVLSKPGWADATPQDLTPASGRQDHTILPYAAASLVSVLLIAHGQSPPCDPIARSTLPRPPQPTPRFATAMIRPSCGVGWGEFVGMICPTGEAKYFCKRG